MDEKKVQTFRQKAIAAGAKSADVDKFINSKRQVHQAADAIQNGYLSIDDLPQDLRYPVAGFLQKKGFKPQQASNDSYDIRETQDTNNKKRLIAINKKNLAVQDVNIPQPAQPQSSRFNLAAQLQAALGGLGQLGGSLGQSLLGGGQ